VKGKTGLRDVAARTSDVKTYFDRIWELRCEELGEAAFGGQRRDLIERREDESDRRARGIYLTPAGRDLQKRVLKVSNAIQRRLLAAVRPADLEACSRAFRMIEAALDQPVERAAVR
jgi:hypothetical protein